MIRLRSHRVNIPPGEFFYVQTEGIHHAFDATPAIELLAKQIVDFRKANGLPGADLGSAISDIDAFTCARLKNNDRWCEESDQSVAATAPAMIRRQGGCSGCGAKVTE